MAVMQLAVVPAGRIDPQEVQEALEPVARALKSPVEFRTAVPLPRGAEDTARGQFKTAALLTGLKHPAGRADRVAEVGDDGSGTDGPGRSCLVAITDVDLFTPSTEFVFSATSVDGAIGLISVKRMREAFYRRKTDHDRQRGRLAKEILRTAGELAGMPACPDPRCSQASTRNLQDIDTKKIRLCAPCWRRLSTGTMSV